MIEKFKNKKIERFFNFYILIFLYSYIFIFPSFSSAALFGGVDSLLTAFGGLVRSAIPIVFGLALVFFFYGVALYIFRAGDEKKAKEGKSIMIYGVIALFVMLSVWGLVQFIGDALGIQTGVSGGTTQTGFSPCDSGYTRAGSQCVPE